MASFKLHRAAWVAFALAICGTAAAGCRADAPAEAPQSGEQAGRSETTAPQHQQAGVSAGTAERTEPASWPVTGAGTARSEGLRRAAGLTFGAPLPEGLDLIHRDDELARFRTDHSYDALIDFYERELRGYLLEEYPEGAKFTPEAEVGADIYVLREDEAEEPGRRVLYFRSEADEEALGFGASPPPVAEAPEASRSEARWAPGLVIPPGHPLAALASEQRGTPGDAGLYYREQFEERDGRTVRVLIPRPPVDSGQPAAPRPPRAGEGRIVGPFDRGNGQRSLTRPRRYDRQGNPLPFAGYQTYEIGDILY